MDKSNLEASPRAIAAQRPWSRKRVVWAVVAVVAVAAVGTPVIGRYAEAARETARRATCVSDMRQLAHALLVYASDYDDRLPPLASGRRDEWVTEARQFISSASMVWCPDDKHYQEYAANRQRAAARLRLPYEDYLRAPRSQVGRVSSYLMNPKLAGVKLGDLRDPAHDILLEEAGEFHKGYRIVAYADGHAKILRRRGR